MAVRDGEVKFGAALQPFVVFAKLPSRSRRLPPNGAVRMEIMMRAGQLFALSLYDPRANLPPYRGVIPQAPPWCRLSPRLRANYYTGTGFNATAREVKSKHASKECP